VDSRTIRIPADDGTIAHALAALDVKLADWAGALRAAEHIIADAVKTGPPSGNDPSPHPATPDGPALEAPPRAAEGQAAVGQVHEPAVAVGPTAASKKAPAVDPAERASERACSAVQSSPAPGVTSVAQPNPPAAKQEQAAPTNSPEDEALLASLDAETAEAVRVMRRLSPVHMSVRELLVEYEASRPIPPAEGQTKKKSWFSRGW